MSKVEEEEHEATLMSKMEKDEQEARLENLQARNKKQKVTPCWPLTCDYFACIITIICLCRERMTTMIGN